VPDIRTHTRVLDTITGPVERPVLRWLAERMPKWVTPDVLTATGVVGAAIVFAGYALSWYSSAFLWLASVGLVVNWFGDSLDGTLARVRHIERPKYGFYLDHTVDVVSEGLVILGIGVSPYVQFPIASVAFIGYLAMSVLAYVRMAVDGVFKISYSRIGPTELRIVVIAFNVVLFAFASVSQPSLPGGLSVADALVGAIAAGLGIAFVVSAIMGAILLRDIDQGDHP
jgi:phosphatidylglycerophosphate synthase